MLRIYLDTCAWGRPFDKPSERIIKETDAVFEILRWAKEGKLHIVGSVVLDVEVGRIESLEKRAVVQRIIELFVSEKTLQIPSAKVEEIIKATDLKLPDAAHLACAAELGCKYFITCDDRMVRKGKEIERLYGMKVCNPVEFAEEEKWLQSRRR